MIALFHVDDVFCASNSTLDQVNGSNWMHFVPDSAPISSFSIPGTHDSAARYIEDIFTPDSSAKTQDLTIAEQLASHSEPHVAGYLRI